MANLPLDELRDEIWEALSDSIDMDWSPTIGADAITRQVPLVRHAPDLLEALRLCIPANVCLTNANIRDDMNVPLDVPMGDLRKIAAAISKATGA